MRVQIGCVLAVLAIGLAGCPEVGLECASTDVVCEETCANVHSDPLHCGGCSTQCPTGFACNDGVCGCPFGITQCAQSCVSLQDNASNCGMCGNACTGQALCQQGSCVDSCAPGMVICGSSCVDPLTDSALCGCGIDGGLGTQCGQGTTCHAGSCESDLFAACASGELIGIDAATQIVGPSKTSPPLSPQAMALYGTNYLEVADGENQQLETFSLDTSPVTYVASSTPDLIGMVPASVTVSGNLAFVVNASDATMDVLDLTKPQGSRRICKSGGSAASYPDGGCPASVAFTPDSYPEFAAVASDAVYVSIQGDLTQDGGPGNEVARVDLNSYAVTYTAITSSVQPPGTQPRPNGVAIANNQLYVALQNLAGYTASGQGQVAIFQLGGPDGGTALSTPPQIISLGPGCLNAGGVLQVGTTLFVACGPQYAMDSSGNYYPAVAGALAGVDLSSNQAAFQPQTLDCPGTGGSCESGGPTQIAYAGGTLFLADSLQGRLFTADPTSGQILRGPQNALQLCSGATSGAGDYVTSVVGIP